MDPEPEEPKADEAAPARAGPFGESWLLVAGLGVVAAAGCLAFGYYDAAFVAAALGVVAWFLNVRSKLPRPPADQDEDEDADLPAEGEDSENKV